MPDRWLSWVDGTRLLDFCRSCRLMAPIWLRSAASRDRNVERAERNGAKLLALAGTYDWSTSVDLAERIARDLAHPPTASANAARRMLIDEFLSLGAVLGQDRVRSRLSGIRDCKQGRKKSRAGAMD
jgi:hypothetical protein